MSSVPLVSDGVEAFVEVVRLGPSAAVQGAARATAATTVHNLSCLAMEPAHSESLGQVFARGTAQTTQQGQDDEAIARGKADVCRRLSLLVTGAPRGVSAPSSV